MSTQKGRWHISQIPDPLYGRMIVLAIGSHDIVLPKVEKKLRLKKDSLTDGSELNKGSVHSFKGGNYVIWLRSVNSSPDSVATLAHEVFHLVKFVMDYIGGELCDGSEESYAYLVGHFTKQIMLKAKHK